MEHFNQSMAWLAKRDGSLIIGHGPFEESNAPPAGGVSFYIQDFALRDAKPWKIPKTVERTTAQEWTSRIGDASPPRCQWAPLDAASFSVVFQEVMSSIQSGIFEKSVPVVTETGTLSEPPACSIMAAMIRQALPLHAYGWMHGNQGFSGATPELLLSLTGNRLETMALAGTARSDDSSAFAFDEKEIREHEYVAQTLVSKLLDLGPTKRSPREILNLGSIVHFLSHIGLDLQTHKTPDELIRKLHPTPALGPLPRTPETLALLFEWRDRLGCPREFGAPFGLLDGAEFDAIVAIRGIWWKDRQLRLPSGCGVIEASRLVNEWRELRLKREAVKHFLG